MRNAPRGEKKGGPSIDRQTALELKAAVRGHSRRSYKEGERLAVSYSDQEIVDFIMNHRDKWPARPGYFAALYDEVLKRKLIV